MYFFLNLGSLKNKIGESLIDNGVNLITNRINAVVTYKGCKV